MTQSRSFPAFTHIALHVADLDKSAAFYERLCGLETVHRREDDGIRVFWLAEPGEAKHFVIVLIEGGNPAPQKKGDISHLGFALESKEAVDRLAEEAGDHLAWPPKQLPPPTGYFCGLKDPDGRVVEFSYGQPLGPGYEA